MTVNREVLEEELKKIETCIYSWEKSPQCQVWAKSLVEAKTKSKALRYAIDILGRVEKLKKRELSGRYGDPSFQQQQNIGFNECVAYLKGE